MDAFIARQPIFDVQGHVYGYELLCRSGPENVFDGLELDQATSKVIADSSFVFGLDGLTRGRLAFINLTRDALLTDVVDLLPPDRTVVEVLETIEPDAEIVDACRELRRRGFLVALDDVVDADHCGNLGGVADIVKIDFLGTDAAGRKAIVAALGRDGLTFLAEKVETHEDFEEAKAIGCSLFQGYFHSRPQMVKGRDLPAFKPLYMRMLREMRSERLEYERIESILRGEMSLSYKLLRYVNSAWMGLREEVTTIRQAMTLLGEKKLRRWATVVAISNLGEDKPREIVIQAVTRARFEELMAPLASLGERDGELFLMGLFSLIDAVMDRPLAKILPELSLAEDVVAGLLGEDNAVANVHGCAVAFESGDWERVANLTQELGIDEEALPPFYLDAVATARQLCSSGD